MIEVSTYAGVSRAEQRLAGGCRIFASSRAAIAPEDAETAHQQDAKEPPFSLSLLTFSSLPSPARAGPLLPPTLPDRASLEPLLARGSFLSGISRRLCNSLRRKQQARTTPSSHDLGPIVSAPCPVRPNCCGYPAIASRARLMRVTAVSILPRNRASRRDRGATRFHGFSEPFGSIR